MCVGKLYITGDPIGNKRTNHFHASNISNK